MAMQVHGRFSTASATLRLAALLLLAANAWFLPRAANAQPEPDGSALIRAAYELTKTASNDVEYRKILDLCEQGVKTGVAANIAAYTNKLKSWAHNRLGQTALDEQKWDVALEHFDTSIALDSTRWLAFHNRGFYYAREEDFQQATTDLRRAIGLNPRSEKSFVYLGDIHYRQGEFSQAINQYNEALRINPQNAEVYSQRGHANFMVGRRAQALRDFNRALQLNAKDVETYIYRGDLYNEAGHYAEAANDYRDAFRLDPESDRAFVSAAWMMATCPDERFRSVESALTTAKRALEMQGNEPHPYRFRYLETLAAAQASAGQYSQAVEMQAEAVESAPKELLPAMQDRLKLYQNN
ncbi:MAG: tetratricopeptide repeat protein, partial [Planctomycetales bacterium]